MLSRDAVIRRHRRAWVATSRPPGGGPISADDLAAIEETLEILGTSEAAEAVNEGRADAAAGRFADNDSLKSRYGIAWVEERHSIRVTARAEHDLQRLPEKFAAACVEFTFGPLTDNPQRVGKPLRGELGGLHSGRRGDYRRSTASSKTPARWRSCT